MKNLTLYYSLSGSTAKRAQDFAQANGSAVIEVKPVKKIGIFRAFVYCPKAMSGKGVSIEPLNLPEYGTVDVFAPIWAGCIAPPMNAALSQLAGSTKVNLHLLSGSGKSKVETVTAQIKSLGLELIGYEDIKA